MRIIIISFVHWYAQKNKTSEIWLVSIYALSATHSRRTIVITCMFSCICSVSNCSIFIIWIWSWNLFIYFIASLRNYGGRATLLFRVLMLLNMNVTLTLMIIFDVVLITATHNPTIVFYFGWLMNYTIICILINVIWWVQSSLKTIRSIPITRL